MFSNDEILSTGYDFTYCYDKVGAKVKAKWKVIGEDKIDIGCGDAFGGGGED